MIYGRGYVGFIIFRPTEPPIFASDEVPFCVLKRMHELTPRVNPNTTLELMAIVGTYMSLNAETFRNKFVNHFGDNTSANAAAIRGYASARDTAMMLNSFSLFMARGNVNIWIEHVPGVENIADLPSRPYEAGNLEAIRGLGASQVPFVFPSLRHWSQW